MTENAMRSMFAFLFTLLVLAGVGRALGGCVSVAPLEKAVVSGARFAVVAEPVLVEAYKAQQLACLTQLEPPQSLECVANVRARWEPVLDTYSKAREAWCAVAVDAGECP